MSYHAQITGLGGPITVAFPGTDTFPAPPGLTAQEKSLVMSAFKGDWGDLTAGVATAAKDKAVAEFQKAVPFDAGQAQVLVDAVNVVSGLFDGKISEKDAVALGETIGQAAGIVIGAAMGSVVPGLGTAIGAVVGLTVSALWNAFEDDSEERKAKAKEARDQMTQMNRNAHESEDQMIEHAWIITARLAGDDALIADYVSLIGRGNAPSAYATIKGLTSAQNKKRKKYVKRALKFMKPLGFIPLKADNAKPVYVDDPPMSAEQKRDLAERRAYCKAHGGRSKGGNYLCDITRRIDWPGIWERTLDMGPNHHGINEYSPPVYLGGVQQRLRVAQRALNIYQAYIAQLNTVSDTMFAQKIADDAARALKRIMEQQERERKEKQEAAREKREAAAAAERKRVAQAVADAIRAAQKRKNAIYWQRLRDRALAQRARKALAEREAAERSAARLAEGRAALWFFGAAAAVGLVAYRKTRRKRAA